MIHSKCLQIGLLTAAASATKGELHQGQEQTGKETVRHSCGPRTGGVDTVAYVTLGGHWALAPGLHYRLSIVSGSGGRRQDKWRQEKCQHTAREQLLPPPTHTTSLYISTDGGKMLTSWNTQGGVIAQTGHKGSFSCSREAACCWWSTQHPGCLVFQEERRGVLLSEMGGHSTHYPGISSNTQALRNDTPQVCGLLCLSETVLQSEWNDPLTYCSGDRRQGEANAPVAHLRHASCLFEMTGNL